MLRQRNPRRGSPSGLTTPIFSFSLSSLEPKSLRMVILTIMLVQVLCCHSITKITRNGINGAIFVTREQLGSAPLKSSSQLVWLASQTTKMQNAVHGDFIKAVSNKHKVIIFLTMESIIQPSIDPQFQSFCSAHCPPQP